MQTIPLRELSIVFIPTIYLLVIMCRWQLKAWVAVYANIRMIFQLLLAGYFLILYLRYHATNYYHFVVSFNDSGFYVDRT